ncbi:unnamed protein product, partial [Gulo gulo]
KKTKECDLQCVLQTPEFQVRPGADAALTLLIGKSEKWFFT